MRSLTTKNIFNEPEAQAQKAKYRTMDSVEGVLSINVFFALRLLYSTMKTAKEAGPPNDPKKKPTQ
jgi:hypothetical protein